MRSAPQFLLSGIAASLLLAIAPTTARSTQTSWTNFPIGDWLIESNWTNGLPADIFGAAQDAFITNGGTAFLNRLFDDPFGGSGIPARANNLSVGFIGNTSGTLLVTRLGNAPPAGLYLQNLYVGVGGASGTGATGTVTISSGASVIQSEPVFGLGFTQLGSGSLAKGTLTVKDAGSFMQTDLLFVGDAISMGTLNIQGGAQVVSESAYIAGSQFFATVATGSSGSATVTGGGSSWTIGGTDKFEIGSKGVGSLTISSGGLVTSGYDATVATVSGSTGTVIVNGAGSVWDNAAGNIYIGGRNGANGGTGTLRIQNAGVVRASSVKCFANGVVDVNNGSSSIAGLIVSGGATVPGAGGSTGDVLVGSTTGGRMEISSGGRVSSLRGHIGFSSGADGAVRVTGAGSRWDCAGSIWAGNSGVGALEVSDGGVVTSAGNNYLGFSSITSGLVRVTGGGSTLTIAGGIFVGGTDSGPGGSGELQIEDGATVNATGTTVYPGAYLDLGGAPTLNGALTIRNGNIQLLSKTTFAKDFTLDTGGVGVHTSTYAAIFSGQISGSGGLTKVSGGFVNPDPGTLTLTGTSNYSGATIVNAGRLIVDGGISSNVTVNNGGTLGGSGAVGGLTVNNGGIVAPGNSPGKLTVNGNYNQTSGGALKMEIGGTKPGAEYDQLEITGAAMLDGTLNLSLVNGFRPTVGEIFAIITSDSETGNFSTINSVGFTVQSDAKGGQVMLTVTAVDPLLRVTDIARSAGEVVITFDATAGNTYRLERKLALSDEKWASIPKVEDVTASTNGPLQITDPDVASPQAFYQVRLLP